MNLAEEYHQHNPEAGKGKQYPYLLEKLQHVNHFNSILDFGAGKGGTARWLNKELNLDIQCYDPGIAAYNDSRILTNRYWDYIYSADVLEHIPLAELKQHTLPLLAGTINYEMYLVIDLTPAKKTLPDGRNAHITLLTEDAWVEVLREHIKIIDMCIDEQPDKRFGTRRRLCVTGRRTKKQ